MHKIKRRTMKKSWIHCNYCCSAAEIVGDWLYWREHLKYVWNVCVVTNDRRHLHTTETTGNEQFSISHTCRSNHFWFVYLNLKHCCSPKTVLRRVCRRFDFTTSFCCPFCSPSLTLIFYATSQSVFKGFKFLSCTKNCHLRQVRIKTSIHLSLC